MSDIPPNVDESADMTAAEYALGVLDEPERAEAAHRLSADPAFAREVGAWQARLAGLARAVPHQSPSASVWAAIERETYGGNVMELKLQRSVAAWRSATAAVGALAAVLAVSLVWPRPTTVAPMMTARLSGASGPAVFVAMFDPARRMMLLAPAAVTSTANRSPELWLIPADGKPIPLGVAAFERVVGMSRPGLKSDQAMAGVLAVSIEPLGGSPTGQPTGPVVATGRLEKI